MLEQASGPPRVTDQVGIGWRAPLAASIFTHLDGIDIVEIIAEDYFSASARILRSMRSLARQVPLAVHGVALGTGLCSARARPASRQACQTGE
jgi:uncharacterized protein (UPF0276 family)